MANPLKPVANALMDPEYWRSFGQQANALAGDFNRGVVTNFIGAPVDLAGMVTGALPKAPVLAVDRAMYNALPKPAQKFVNGRGAFGGSDWVQQKLEEIKMLPLRSQTAVGKLFELGGAVAAPGIGPSELMAMQDAAGAGKPMMAAVLSKMAPKIDDVDDAMKYKISHRPMTVDAGAAHLNDAASSFGEDIYGPNALQYFGSGHKKEKDVLRILKSVRGNPDASVTIYRGVPDNASKINPGDWVTLDKSVAEEYAALEKSGKVISMKGPASHVTTWADSLLEFGYHPPK